MNGFIVGWLRQKDIRHFTSLLLRSRITFPSDNSHPSGNIMSAITYSVDDNVINLNIAIAFAKNLPSNQFGFHFPDQICVSEPVFVFN